MFSTDKEVHIYMDGALQMLQSNRKQSIAPELMDMFLNNSLIEYVSSRFPNNVTNKDIESTLERYTDFSVLKASLAGIPVIESIEGYVAFPKPHNALKVQAVKCSYTRPFSNSDISIDHKYTGIIKIHDDVYTESNPYFSFTIRLEDGSVKEHIVNLKPYISSVRSRSGVFYLYDCLMDYLWNVCGVNAKYNSYNEVGTRSIYLDVPVGNTILVINSNSSYIKTSIVGKIVRVANGTVTASAVCSLYQAFDAKVGLADFYRAKNMHRDPIAEMNAESVITYYTDFIPTHIAIHYIRKPRLFNIATGQIPEINITKDFLDYAVKNIHLILNSPHYDRVVNEMIKKS